MELFELRDFEEVILKFNGSEKIQYLREDGTICLNYSNFSEFSEKNIEQI